MLSTNDSSILKEEIRLLREELEKLKEENRQLRKSILPSEWTPPLEFCFSPIENIIFAILYKNAPNLVSKERFMDAAYGMRAGDKIPEPKIVDVWICKIRSKIRDHGLMIENIHGQGYRLTQESAEILNNW